MKLASLRSDSKHGQLVVVSKDNKSAVKAQGPTSLLEALENWSEVVPTLEQAYRSLNSGSAADAFALRLEDCLAPLPYAPGFYDGSAFLSHVVRARRSRGDEMPESARVTPLMYQGVSDCLLPFNAPIELMDPNFGGDFEGEFAAITDFVPRGTPAEKMDPHLVLFTLFNDITYREIVKTEIQTKFGFLQSKPNSSFAPFVVTRDELGDAWKDGRIELEMEVRLNGELFGNPSGREMNFSFQQLVAHACRTRPLSPGNIVGTGTVSNEDKNRGFACLTEARYQEIMDTGNPVTPWLKVGDNLRIDVRLAGTSLFGCIDEKVIV
ncbi:MAG: fumarylacetoacetate hydrolase family protein [Bdellovibrionales bacterium]|nr:fumarylacetoacetate hydrolase family protein [Bdellovibrionales bacterium]